MQRLGWPGARRIFRAFLLEQYQAVPYQSEKGEISHSIAVRWWCVRALLIVVAPAHSGVGTTGPYAVAGMWRHKTVCTHHQQLFDDRVITFVGGHEQRCFPLNRVCTTVSRYPACEPRHEGYGRILRYLSFPCLPQPPVAVLLRPCGHCQPPAIAGCIPARATDWAKRLQFKHVGFRGSRADLTSLSTRS